jgi:signal transduction histidine kinase
VSPPARTILYVDDEPANLSVFEYCFRDRFELVTARGGEEALAILARQPIAVLLTDQRMPGMTGAELCAAARERFPDVVRMIVTAYADIGAAVAAINSGQVSRYVVKPWREEQMADILSAGIEAYVLGVTIRELQVRMLQSEQQATTSFVLGRVLHELSQPLTVARAGMTYVSDCVGALARADALPPAARLDLAELQAAVHDTQAAVEEAAARLHRFRQGEQPAAREVSVELNRAVEAALAIIGGELRRRARVKLELGVTPPVAADPAELSQILMNLLTNAADAVGGGRPQENVITIRTMVRGERVLLEVEDTGPGIAPELLPRIFEPFVSTKDDDVPRGLGLAVVRDLVRRRGGEIQARSEPGRGSCFAVELPAGRRG